MMNYKLSPMSISDLKSISTQMDSHFESFWSFEMFLTELQNPDAFYIVAKDITNTIVGFRWCLASS